MVDGKAHRHFNEIAAKWRDLAEKRRLHFVELHRSGRWKRYYKSEAQFLLRMREAVMIAEGWAMLVPRDEPAEQPAKSFLTHSPRQSAA